MSGASPIIKKAIDQVCNKPKLAISLDIINNEKDYLNGSLPKSSTRLSASVFLIRSSKNLAKSLLIFLL